MAAASSSVAWDASLPPTSTRNGPSTCTPPADPGRLPSTAHAWLYLSSPKDIHRSQETHRHFIVQLPTADERARCNRAPAVAHARAARRHVKLMGESLALP